MSRYPTAVWDPIPENATQPKIRPTQFIFHRQAGLGDLHDYYAQLGIVVESQLWVAKTGRAKQYLDSTVRADANYLANKRPDGTGAVSCEFEGGLQNEPLTPEQVATAIALLRDAHRLDGIPLRRCTDPDDPGIGWHVMWGAPGAWTPVEKSCPTKPVIAQIPDIIAAAQEDDVTPQDIEDIAEAVWKRTLVLDETSASARSWLVYGRRDVGRILDKIDPAAFAEAVGALLADRTGLTQDEVKEALAEVLRRGTDPA